jgi:site-specific recombinase
MAAKAQLAAILESIPADEAWLEELLRWLLEAPARPGAARSPRTERLRVLARMLEEHPRSAELKDCLQGAFTHASAVRLMAETGLPDHPGVLKEICERLVNRLLPRMDPEGDLYALVERLELSGDDAEWFAALSEEDLAPWLSLFAGAREACDEAAFLLAVRASGLGLSRELLRLTPDERDLDSPFAHLPGAIQSLGQAGGAAHWRTLLGSCRAELARMHASLEERGVSLGLVFQLELLEAQLERLDRLAAVMQGAQPGASLAAELVRGSVQQRRIAPLLRQGLHRLSRKIVEHTGRSGEHYLAPDRKEYRSLFLMAGGGGAITALTALFKILIPMLPFAPGPLGLCFAFNYSASFILMQFLHFPLASKQPAMTAASLAAVLELDNGLEEEIQLTASIARGQAAATFGNLLLTIPSALLVDGLWRLVSGHGVADALKAEHLIHELHPFATGTLFYAALTGVFLWMASLAAGWAANWSAFRSLPLAVSRSPLLRRFLGPGRAARMGQGVDIQFPGIVGYVCLGLLLGFMPLFFTFAGLPLEVRHVTLSAASLSYGAAQQLWEGSLQGGPILWAGLGVLCIGLLNFSVSFLLALGLAVQSRGLSLRAQTRLLMGLLKAFAASPWRFVLPISAAAGSDPPSHR